jgi:hypothetical protein
VQVVNRRVLEKDDAGRNLHAVENDVDGRAFTGPVILPIDQFAGDVGVPAQRVEAVLLVVIERRDIAQLFPDGVGVVVDVEVERVVVRLNLHPVCHTTRIGVAAGGMGVFP